MTPAPPVRLPLRRSLLTRLLLVSLLIALISIGATAWLTVTTTTRALQQEKGDVLSSQARTYEALVDYAVSHQSWDGVGPLLKDLASRAGWDLRLTTREHAPIAEGRVSSQPQWPARPFTVVDALNEVAPLASRNTSAAIDERIIGPYRLSRPDQRSLLSHAHTYVNCLRSVGVFFPVSITQDDTGRPRVHSPTVTNLKAQFYCDRHKLDLPTASQNRALKKLNAGIAACLSRLGQKPVTVGLDFEPVGQAREGAQVSRCVHQARQKQLRSYAAPPALLYIGSAQVATTSRVSLSAANIWRIVLVTGTVLVLTMLLTTLAGLRLVRPLRHLLRTVQHPSGTALAEVRSNDEIGLLTASFNDLTSRRQRLETQRKAMISDIAHELRTPLSNVRGWLQAAEDNIVARDQALTASLLEEALHLKRIVDDLQDLAQADAGELHLEHEAVDLAELIALLIHTHRGAADLAGVQLRSDIAPGVVIRADPTRLRQVVGNLMSNAIRHTPDGGSVLLRTSIDAAGMVRIDVADTGVGISPEDLPHVFDRFWRAERSRSRSNGGSGLGLSIARQLVLAHRGEIAVVSELGVGTTFTITLPGR